MSSYTPYDYLWPEPYMVDGIGKIKCPTLTEIRNMTYNMFCCYLNMTLATADEFISSFHIDDGLSKDLSLYSIFILTNPQLLLHYIRAFITNDIVKFNEKEMSVEIIDIINGSESFVGKINESNFESFRNSVALALGLKNVSEKPLKFKNDHALKLREKFKKNTKSHTADPNYSLDNMILKFCTFNKTGINMLNVGNLTYYQFTQLFNEYVHARQSDYGDSIAANTFSYNDSKDYKSTMWIEKLKTDNY